MSQRKEKSGTIAELLKKETCYRESEAVFLYMDYRSEVMTTLLAEELLTSGKRVFAPRVIGFDIVFYEIRSLDDLEAGYQGIREPVEKPEMLLKETVLQEKRCLVLVPERYLIMNATEWATEKAFMTDSLKNAVTM